MWAFEIEVEEGKLRKIKWCSRATMYHQSGSLNPAQTSQATSSFSLHLQQAASPSFLLPSHGFLEDRNSTEAETHTALTVPLPSETHSCSTHPGH